MHTEYLVWFSKAKCEAILLHDLAILLCSFGPHCCGFSGLRGRRDYVQPEDACVEGISGASCRTLCINSEFVLASLPAVSEKWSVLVGLSWHMSILTPGLCRL